MRWNRRLFVIAVSAFLMLALSGCFGGGRQYEHTQNDGHEHDYSANSGGDYICSECGDVMSTALIERDQEARREHEERFEQSRQYSQQPAPQYEDTRWPTTSPELLAIPESNRWYNARNHVGTTCTIAGPVVGVYCAEDSAGKPVFVNIGAAYPNQECVQLVVWTEGDWSSFSRMLTDVDMTPNCWLSVTGYLSSYNGYMQFDTSDGYVEYTWWTNVS